MHWTPKAEGGKWRGWLSRSKAGQCFSCAAVTLLSGCASQAPLRPPSLHLPATIRSLSADRTGDAVDLHWMSPTRTTDGILLNGKRTGIHLSAEICREDGPGQACKTVGRLHVESGMVAGFHDRLTPALSTGPARPLVYRVRVLNGEGKGAAYLPVKTLAGEAPHAIAALQAEPVADGVALRWQADATSDRVLIRVTRGKAGAEGASADGASLMQAGEALLAIESQGRDPGGALDTGARAGVAQRYAVSRTRTLRVGAEDLSISSVPAPIAVSSEAKSAPRPAPTGLQTLFSTLAGAEIDLVWDPVPNVVGYRVFRAASGSSTPVLLTIDPVRVPSYTDKAVLPGVRYRYSVSAVNDQGVAGSRSAEVSQAIPSP